MTYIISTVFKPSIKGGVYYCNVFELVVDSNHTNHPYQKFVFIDVTKNISDKFGLRYKTHEIQIPHGSGTGFNVLSDLIRHGTGIDSNQIFDATVFNF